MVSKYDTNVLLTREIHVFRVIQKDNKYGIDPFYLLYLLSHKLTQKQLTNKVMIDTTLPNIGRRWEELYLPVSKSEKERNKIKERMSVAFFKKAEAQKEIHLVKEEFGDLTT